MIGRENRLLLGSIAKPHGTKGLMLIRLKDIKPEEIKKRDSVFVEIDGLPVPFFIEEFKAGSENSLILKLEDVDSESKAKSLAGKQVYVSAGQVKKKKSRPDKFISVHGYKVTDTSLGFIGIAGDITGTDTNPLLRVRHEDKDYLVPVHEDIILEIDDKAKEIVIDAPEGLFEIV